MIGTHTFEEACQSAEKTAKAYQELVAKTGKLHFFRRWSLRELRTKHYIFPMESVCANRAMAALTGSSPSLRLASEFDGKALRATC
jgi:hypothetical protein